MGNSNIDGQLSFWEIEVPASVSKVNKITEEVINVVRSITDGQEKVINKYKLHDELSRIIQYAGGGIGIELNQDNGFKTIYVNKSGQEEFMVLAQVPVQPIDTIMISKNNFELTEIQINRLQDLRQRYNLENYIKRKGDMNVIVKTDEKVIAINQKGWILEYSEAIYEASEVSQFENLKIKYNVGDLVEAKYGKEIIIGNIYSKYQNQDSVNIVWNNRHSAFHISSIIRKIA